MAELTTTAECLRLLGHAQRLAILLRLAAGACPVASLQAELGLEQPWLSQNLARLRKAGLIAAERQGRNVIYRTGDLSALEALRPLFAAAPEGALPGGAPPAPAARRPEAGAALFARIEGGALTAGRERPGRRQKLAQTGAVVSSTDCWWKRAL
ncbi:ArsR/SmtB family transcription factor [Tistlia consotensis]|nr:metalloregulator ArsR/SmtB family transcription factor [Tistlia consotensis]